jgi:hypothetical protein
MREDAVQPFSCTDYMRTSGDVEIKRLFLY